MTTAIHSPADPRTVDQLWIAIVRHYQEAKAFARCGQAEHARSLLGDALPGAIREWSRQSGLPRQLQILRLRKLLQGDLKMVLRPRAEAISPKTATVVRSMELASKTKDRWVQNAESSRSDRIRITDISGMIDSVHLAEARSRAEIGTHALPQAS